MPPVRARSSPERANELPAISTDWNAVPSGKSLLVAVWAEPVNSRLEPGRGACPPTQFAPVVQLLSLPWPSQTKGEATV